VRELTFLESNDKKPGPLGPGFRWFVSRSLAADCHVRGPGPFGAILDLELDLVTLVEGAKALGLDLGVMDENVGTTLARQKTETL
jgi:hypothetical protein